MDRYPLVRELIDLGAELVREFDKFTPVKVAFWMKASDEEQRSLVIAGERFDTDGALDGYGEVIRLAKKIDSEMLESGDVKLIGANTRLAKDVEKVNTKFPNPKGNRLRGMFGGTWAEDLYIYPSPIPETMGVRLSPSAALSALKLALSALPAHDRDELARHLLRTLEAPAEETTSKRLAIAEERTNGVRPGQGENPPEQAKQGLEVTPLQAEPQSGPADE